MAQWLRMQMLGMVDPNSNSGKFSFQHFCAPFYPAVTFILEYFDPSILYTLIWFLLYKFVAVTLLLFKPSKGIQLHTILAYNCRRVVVPEGDSTGRY